MRSEESTEPGEIEQERQERQERQEPETQRAVVTAGVVVPAGVRTWPVHPQVAVETGLPSIVEAQ